MTQQEHGSVAMGDIGEDGQCPRPCNGRPDEFSMRQCIGSGECGCIAFPSRPEEEPVAFPGCVLTSDGKTHIEMAFETEIDTERAVDLIERVLFNPSVVAPQPAHGTSATERVPATFEAAWQAFQNCPIDGTADDEENTRSQLKAALEVAAERSLPQWAQGELARLRVVALDMQKGYIAAMDLVERAQAIISTSTYPNWHKAARSALATPTPKEGE